MTATERIKCLRTGVLQTFWRKPRFTCFSFVRCGVCANFHPSRLTPRVCNAGLVFLNFLFLGWCLPLGTEMQGPFVYNTYTHVGQIDQIDHI